MEFIEIGSKLWLGITVTLLLIGVALFLWGNKKWSGFGSSVVTGAVVSFLILLVQHDIAFQFTLATQKDLTGMDLSGQSLEDRNFAGKILDNANLVGANLRGANLSNTSLIGADLERAILTGADLIGANLFVANLDDAKLRNADFRYAKMEDTQVWGTSFPGVIVNSCTCWPNDYWSQVKEELRPERFGTEPKASIGHTCRRNESLDFAARFESFYDWEQDCRRDPERRELGSANAAREREVVAGESGSLTLSDFRRRRDGYFGVSPERSQPS